MPANTKYLTKSSGQRFATITAGFLGGYMVSIALHAALAAWFARPTVLVTSTFSAFLVWAMLFVLAFLSRNGWTVWVIYLMCAALGALLTYLATIIPF